MWKWGLRLALLPAFVARDVWRRLGGTGQSAIPLRVATFSGGPIAVVALHQDGQIRPDILRLMLALRRAGVYVMAVNAGRLNDAGALLPADCYVERRNYGRDFGSYRRGVLLIEEKGWTPARLLLLNDSVFYLGQGLDAFIARLVDTPSDICSATESIEVLPHQTSFCLSFSARCVSSRAFRRFWRFHRPSDLRPAAVLFGEIALSSRLRRAGFRSDAIASHAHLRGVLSSDDPDTVPVEWLLAGNVSHRVPGELLDLGVPLVKLDLLRRAALSRDDISPLHGRLAPEDSAMLEILLREKAEGAGKLTALDRLGARCGLS